MLFYVTTLVQPSWTNSNSVQRCHDSLHDMSHRYESTGFTTVFPVFICNHWYFTTYRVPYSPSQLHQYASAMHMLIASAIILVSSTVAVTSWRFVLCSIVTTVFTTVFMAIHFFPIQQSLEQPATGSDSNPCGLVTSERICYRFQSAWILPRESSPVNCTTAPVP